MLRKYNATLWSRRPAWGFLFDGDGSDWFWANGSAVSGGAALGVGLLVNIARPGFVSANDNYTANKTIYDPGPRYGANGGITGVACPGKAVCMDGSVGMLLDVTGMDDYCDDDYSGNPLDPYPACDVNKCIFPKYAAEEGYGQQRDVSTALYASVASLTTSCLLT